jgi:small-conductance mechanosensitive channel
LPEAATRGSLIGVTRRGELRASDAERDATVDRLHRAATEGRIGSDELEQRVSVALKARTYAELDATVADLPSPRSRSRARHPAVPAARWAARSVRANPMLLLVVLPALALTFALLVTVTIMWAVLMVVAMVLGHRGGGPWIGPGAHRYAYARHHHGLRTARRRPGGSWL